MKKGFVTMYVLVFGSLLLVVLGGVFGFVLFELRRGKEQIAWERSLQAAESGVNYYRWCMNNEVEDSCAGERPLEDLDGNLVGYSDIDATSQFSCGQSSSSLVDSTGWDVDFPDITREVKASIGRISVAKFAYLLDDNVWAGSDREVRGVYHSNGGIRMDGENQSLVTSAREDWLCTSSFGCNYWDCPSDCAQEGEACRCPGIFTTTGNSSPDLFEYPVPAFDFEGITIDLNTIKELTIDSPQNRYWPKVEDIDPSGEGYYFVLKNNGQIEVRIITELSSDDAYSEEEGWHQDYFSISSEYLYKTIDVDPSCSLIFVEDNLWIEGEVEGMPTIASADLESSTGDTTIVLVGDITYMDGGLKDGLGLIAEKNILISPDSPDQMEIEGIFVAQEGHFGRNLYEGNTREKLEIIGSIVSNGRVGTKWVSGSVVVSGYLKRENYIDTDLVYSPPPFIPSVSEDFQIYDWREVEK